MLLKGALKQAKGDADKFFAIFDTLAWGPPADFYRDALNKFFVGNAYAIMGLGLSIEQIESIDHYIDRHSTSIKILELTLEKAEHAGDFFNIFHTVAPDSPDKKSQQVYGNFLIDHAEEIVALGPSLDQTTNADDYVPMATILDVAEKQKRKKTRKKAREVCAASAAALLL